ncbi:hypothetical protein EVAR_56928_1 [Eumeta japonica]|uniref:Uncharacterized protein n=1 Tax=Eumeta variegata TaxID=151549 RepID=A0A4C1YEI4_EUMVA|nr:hypothetical protein EVAR_56928_1 [Eumeta japonica]
MRIAVEPRKKRCGIATRNVQVSSQRQQGNDSRAIRVSPMQTCTRRSARPPYATRPSAGTSRYFVLNCRKILKEDNRDGFEIGSKSITNERSRSITFYVFTQGPHVSHATGDVKHRPRTPHVAADSFATFFPLVKLNRYR